MKQRKGILAISTLFIAILTLTSAIPTAAQKKSDILPKGNFVLASPSSADVDFTIVQTKSQIPEDELIETVLEKTVNGADLDAKTNDGIKGAISFYMPRSYRDNTAQFPPAATVEIVQKKGSPVGALRVTASNALEDMISITVEEDYLSADTPVRFSVEFIDEGVRDGSKSVINGPDNYISINGPEDSGLCWKIRILYGSDGLHMLYSTDYSYQYEGELLETTSGEYAVIGDVSLNGNTPPSLNVVHKFFLHASMRKVHPDLKLETALLDPEGLFTFEDGSYEKELGFEPGIVSISIQMKPEIFRQLKQEAVSAGKSIDGYWAIPELVLVHSDGYASGGKSSILPLAYRMTYTPPYSSGNDNDENSGDSSNVTVYLPEETARLSYTSEGDLGWTRKDDGWYYLKADNSPVTDWLLGPDGRWYFFDERGKMQTGWLQLDMTWYFLNADGAMATGWIQNTDGTWYYFLPNGSMAVNTMTPDGYQVNQTGAWVNEDKE